MNVKSISDVRDWLMGQCRGDQRFRESGGGLKLFHRDTLATSRAELVAEFPFDADVGLDELASAIYQTAYSEAHGGGPGAHQFTVRAFRDGDDEHFARKQFRIAVEADETAAPQDQTSADGLLAQTMRHLEATHRQMAAMLPTVMGAVHQTQDILARRNAGLEANLTETFALMKDLIQEKDRRQSELRVIELREQRHDKMVDRFGGAVMLMAPKIMEKLGVDIGGEDADQGPKDTDENIEGVA